MDALPPASPESPWLAPPHAAGLAVTENGGFGDLNALSETGWYDIPGVRIVGAVLGAILLVAAIRAMFGKGGR